MAAITAAITAGVAAAGLGMEIYGASKASAGAAEQAKASQAIAGDEIQQDALRRQAMELSAARQGKEILRNSQRARAMALNATTNQGGQTGNTSSALGGAQGQVSGQTNLNALGLDQSLSLGRSMFDLNTLINQQKMIMAQAGGQIATGQGFMGIGGSLMNSAGSIGNLGGSAPGFFSGWGSGDPSSGAKAMSPWGYPTGKGG